MGKCLDEKKIGRPKKECKEQKQKQNLKREEEEKEEE